MSLRKDLAKGTFYLAIAKYSGIIVSLVVTAILSRILTPEDYGVVAVSFVFIAFFNILSDVGIGPAVIQNKELSVIDLNNIFSFTIYSGIILGVIFFFCSNLIAEYYSNYQLVNICRLLSLSILFYCVNIVPTNLLYKNKNFKYISFTSFYVQLLLGTISIFAAFSGVGIYSLLISPVLSPLLLFIIYNHHVGLRFKIRCELSSLKKIVSFSAYQFLFNIVNYFSRNADKLLLGKFVGMSQLGQYEKSYRLMMLPLQNITFVVTPVMHPVFSEFQNDLKSMAEKYCQVVNLLGYVGFPLSALLYFTAKPLIVIIFGEQWLPAVKPFQILSFSVGIQIITSTTASIFQASNSTKRLFMTSVLVAICMVGSFIIAACYYKSIIAMAYAFLIAKTLDMIISYVFLMKTICYPVTQIWRALIKPILIAIMIFGILYLCNLIFIPSGDYVSLFFNVLIGGISFFILCEWLGEVKPFKLVKQIIHKKI